MDITMIDFQIFDLKKWEMALNVILHINKENKNQMGNVISQGSVIVLPVIKEIK